MKFKSPKTLDFWCQTLTLFYRLRAQQTLSVNCLQTFSNYQKTLFSIVLFCVVTFQYWSKNLYLHKNVIYVDYYICGFRHFPSASSVKDLDGHPFQEFLIFKSLALAMTVWSSKLPGWNDQASLLCIVVEKVSEKTLKKVWTKVL